MDVALGILGLFVAILLGLVVIAASLLGVGELLWSWWVDRHDAYDVLDDDHDESNQD